MTTPLRPNRVTLALAATLTLLVLGGPLGAADLGQVLARFDEVQDSIRTLSADFRETTTNPLLLDPVTSEGRFYLTKPDAIRWEYTLPEEMRFVIADDQYIGYFPTQRRAERRSVQRWSKHIFRFFGLGQGSDELGKFYNIRLDESRNDIAGTYLLILEPKKKRVRRRVEEAWFWLDASTYLPVAVEYRAPAGNNRRIDFEDIRMNPDLSAGLYEVVIPAGVEISNGFSGLPSFHPDTTQ